MVALAGWSGSEVDDGGSPAGSGRHDPLLSATERREIDSLAAHVRADHPDVPLSEITSILEQEYAGLARSRVQGFRMVLAERAARRRLGAARDPKHAGRSRSCDSPSAGPTEVSHP